MAGMMQLFKKKYLWGFVLFALGVSMLVYENHLQITFYTMLFCLFVYLGYLIIEIKSKDYKSLLKASGLMVVGVALAACTGLGSLYGNWEMSKASLRGPTELTPDPVSSNPNERVSSGLDKDYAFQWSYGWKELLSTLIPNVYGGPSGGVLSSDSNLAKEYRAHGVQSGSELRAPTYWGDKPFTSGPVYFGAIVCFLFVLGMFVVKNPLKWWIFGGGLFLAFLALGRNFDLFNDFMFHHLPLYNKFRTPEMALVIPEFVFPLIGVWGLKEIFTRKVTDDEFKKGFCWSLGITGGLSLIIWLMPSLLLSFRSNYDAQFQSQGLEWYYNALLMDREAIASADALRSLVFILLGAALLYWYWKAKNKQSVAIYAGIGLTILTLADLWSVDKRYLNEKNFDTPQATSIYSESTADKAILQDKDPSFRVFNLNNPWQETTTAYYHKSIGGYHAAKLRRYQELIDHRLEEEQQALISALQSAKTADDMDLAFRSMPSLNMLNTRYIIYNPAAAPLYNPYALGNAWFVDKIEIVPNADAEIKALDSIDPKTTAVIDERFAADVKGFTPKQDSTATIELESYAPNKLVYKSNSNSEQLAVFSEIYYQPGWVATIDGKEAPHFRVDWTLRGMLIPAGEHTIVYEFKPIGYLTAQYISSYASVLITLLLIGAILWSGWCMFKKKDSGNEVM
jgi:hypothetical protein